MAIQFIQYLLIKTWEHLELTFLSIFVAMLIAIPLAIFLTRCNSLKASAVIMRCIAIIQTIPGLALIALIVVFIVFIRPLVHLPATGLFPSVIVLTVYALLPILSNTYSGIKQIDPKIIEVAKAMGMTDNQILVSIEIPMALPVIMSGIRISLVWTVGMATLTSLVGSGGLGDLIMQGLRSMHVDLILSGTLPAALLAIILDWTAAKVGVWLNPKPMYLEERK